ncbi:hypothetical protein M5689_013627 [Euphorbia peplus]|nr:hypothetical protein M5689_013627 [Euphorbia peplus]
MEKANVIRIGFIMMMMMMIVSIDAASQAQGWGFGEWFSSPKVDQKCLTNCNNACSKGPAAASQQCGTSCQKTCAVSAGFAK